MGHTGETPGWGTPTWNGRKIHYLQRDLDAKANRVPSGFSIIACWEWLPLTVQRERKAGEVIKGYAKIFQKILKTIISVQFSSITESCPTLCDPMDCSTPGLPVHHQLPEFTQTHILSVRDAIQPSHPLSSPSPPALNLSHHQGLFKWVSSSHQVAKVLEFQLQHQFLQWIFRSDFF